MLNAVGVVMEAVDVLEDGGFGATTAQWPPKPSLKANIPTSPRLNTWSQESESTHERKINVMIGFGAYVRFVVDAGLRPILVFGGISSPQTLCPRAHIRICGHKIFFFQML